LGDDFEYQNHVSQCYAVAELSSYMEMSSKTADDKSCKRKLKNGFQTTLDKWIPLYSRVTVIVHAEV
jgi:hypothetical protein